MAARLRDARAAVKIAKNAADEEERRMKLNSQIPTSEFVAPRSSATFRQHFSLHPMVEIAGGGDP